MSERKEEHINDVNENIKFGKELQLTTSYYTLLLFFAIIALFKLPGPTLKKIVTETYWIVGILTVFGLVYQIHISYSLWKYRDKAGINNREKKISLIFYTMCFVALIGLVSFITFAFLSSV